MEVQNNQGGDTPSEGPFPRATLGERELAIAKQDGLARSRAGVSRQVDQFITTRIPPQLRGVDSIHHVGTILGEGGQALVLIRFDGVPGPGAASWMEGPSILFVRSPDDGRTNECIAVLSLPAAEAVASLIRRDVTPDAAGPKIESVGGKASARGSRAGAVVTFCRPPHSDGFHLVGLLKTLGGEDGLIIRASDGGVSLGIPHTFQAHLSPAASDALACVLEEFVSAHPSELVATEDSLP